MKQSKSIKRLFHTQLSFIEVTYIVIVICHLSILQVLIIIHNANTTSEILQGDLVKS